MKRGRVPHSQNQSLWTKYRPVCLLTGMCVPIEEKHQNWERKAQKLVKEVDLTYRTVNFQASKDQAYSVVATWAWAVKEMNID